MNHNFKGVNLLLTLTVVTLALAACGGGNNIEVTATDFKYDPTTWTVSAGQTVTITLINKGANLHEWVLIKQGESVTQPFDDDDEDKVFWEIEAEAGETKTETFTAPSEPGTYTIVCGIPGHIEQGMEATLVVK
jgi:nitrite reductase (NO-forming)